MKARAPVGLQKTSLVDFPGHVAATIFVAGCNLRCPFCHNPDLARGLTPLDFMPVSETISFLRRRAGVLTGVCLTGGEPTLYPDLVELVAVAKSLGLAVKVDTNGMQPDRLCGLGADYIALDLKTSPRRYGELGASGFEPVRATMRYLRSSRITYEYRTTIVSGLVDPGDVEEILYELEPGERWWLQAFRPDGVLDPSYRLITPPTSAYLKDVCSRAESLGVRCSIRSSY